MGSTADFIPSKQPVSVEDINSLRTDFNFGGEQGNKEVKYEQQSEQGCQNSKDAYITLPTA